MFNFAAFKILFQDNFCLCNTYSYKDIRWLDINYISKVIILGEISGSRMEMVFIAGDRYADIYLHIKSNLIK